MAMVLLLITVGLIPSLIMVRIAGLNEDMIRELHIFQKTIEVYDLSKIAKVNFDAFLMKREKDITPIIRFLDRSIDASKKLLGIVPEEEREVVEGILKNTKRFKIAVVSYADEIKYDPAGSTASEMKKIIFDVSLETHQLVTSLLKDVQKDIQATHATMTYVVKKNQLRSFAGLAAGIAAGLIIAFVMARALSRPIKQLIEGTQRIAKGDLTYRVEAASRDEIGQLAGSFNKMADELLASEQQLKASEQQLKASNQQLKANEQALLEAQEGLKKEVESLENFKKLTVGRELRMIGLKKEVDELLKELGREPRYRKEK